MNKIHKNKRKTYKTIYILSLIILLLAFSSFNILANDSNGGGLPNLVIQTPPVVSALPIFWMLENNMLDYDVDVSVRISPDHQRTVQLLAQEELDMVITGVNVGARAFNRGIDIRLLNTNIWAIDYLLTYDFEANTWEDLKGKTLSLPLQGGPLDFLARYLLINNGVDLDEVDFVYRPSQKGAQMFQLGDIDSIILPEPMLTTTLNNADQAHLSMDIQEEWGKLHDGEERIPFVGLFIRGAFARNNRELVENINHYYKEGVEWVNDNPDKAAEMAEKYFDMPAPVIEQAFNRIDLSIYPEDETYALINLYFTEILDMYPEMIGGNLPNELFYF